MPVNNSKEQLRLRVFAGPNGSGKSTVIEEVKDYKVKNKAIDFGYYVNADEIACLLRTEKILFSEYDIKVINKEFQRIAIASGLINKDFKEEAFKNCYTFRNNTIKLKDKVCDERLAQIIADFLRKKLLQERKCFSFETVFSHPSKLDIMREVSEAGYKVYLYFVSTETPEINKFRVEARKAKGGHDVPPKKIEDRYYRSLNLLFEAASLAYRTYFFDNSIDGKKSTMFGCFERVKKKEKWEWPNGSKNVP